MTAATLSVLCANCGGDERLSRLEEGSTACRWCGLSFDDAGTPAREPGRLFLQVVAPRTKLGLNGATSAAAKGMG